MQLNTTVNAQTKAWYNPEKYLTGLFGGRHAFANDLQVSVIVPVRNEAAHITKTLEALRTQEDEAGNALRPGFYEVLVLANNCTDQTANIIHHYKKKHPDFPLFMEDIKLPASTANIGFVRRMLMDAAFRRLHESGNPNGIIASTDGDTIVDRQWIYHITQEILNGNDAVGGRILTKTDRSPARLYHLRSVMYRSLLTKAAAIIDPSVNDPWPCHFQYFGASLAVTCNMYERAGRLPQVPYLEDNAFLDALNSIDAKVRKSNQVKVYTSTREQGRVEVGFSEQLNKWNSLAMSASEQLAEPTKASLLKLQNRFALRTCRDNYLTNGLQQQELSVIANELCIDAIWLKKQFSSATYFGALWQQVEHKMATGTWAKMWKPVPITAAIHELRLFIEQHR